MQNRITRFNGRDYDALRPITVAYDVYGYAAASVLFSLGNTKVACAITLQPNVPLFLKGKKMGWLTAEYAMLPTATPQRSSRESSHNQRNGRSVEISRVIGRSLRSMVNLSALGEQTIVVDCDVLQADGSTRTACITAASMALCVAVDRWIQASIMKETVIIEPIAAVSVGIHAQQPLLDIDFKEDSAADADFNFIMTQSGRLVEIQGTAEKVTVSWDEFDAVRMLASSGITQLFSHFKVPVYETQHDAASTYKIANSLN